MMTQHAHEHRRQVRVSGAETLADVARNLGGDARVAGLLADLNPGLPLRGPLPAGAVVTCPTRAEAQKFAARMGFQLGFDPTRGGGTDQRRKWARMQAAQVPSSSVSAAASARELVAAGVPARDVARNISRSTADIAHRFVRDATDHPELAPVRAHVALSLARTQARANLKSVADFIEATLAPAGLRALLTACTIDVRAVDGLLAALAVPVTVRLQLRGAAPAAHALCEAVEAEGARARPGPSVGRHGGPQTAMQALMDAHAAGLPLVDGARLPLLGIAPVVEGLRAALLATRERALAGRVALDQAPETAVRGMACCDDVGLLPMPWCQLEPAVRAVSSLVPSIPLWALELGVGGALDPKARVGSATPASPMKPGVVRASSLQARAAVAAVRVDEAASWVERLVPIAVSLWRAACPRVMPTVAARRAQLEGRLTSGDVDSVHVATELAALLRVAARAPAVAQSVGALGTRERDVLSMVAGQWTTRVLVGHRYASDFARALVLAVVAAEPECQRWLCQTNGAEVIRRMLDRHGARLLAALVSVASAS